MFNPTALIDAARKIVMDRVEKGVHVASDIMVELLKKTVDGSGGMQPRTRTRPSFMFRRRTKNGGRWESYPPEWDSALRLRDIAPGKQTGAAQRSITYQIVSRDDSRGEIRVRIGVDASAPGGMHTLPSYLFGHEVGIRYPTRGPMKGTGPVIQRPWLRTTFDRYFDSFQSIVLSVAQTP